MSLPLAVTPVKYLSSGGTHAQARMAIQHQQRQGYTPPLTCLVPEQKNEFHIAIGSDVLVEDRYIFCAHFKDSIAVMFYRAVLLDLFDIYTNSSYFDHDLLFHNEFIST